MDFTTNWGWPQWAYAILMLLSLIVGTAMHGKPRPAYDGFGTLISFGIAAAILTAGGFFA
jgi:hypothetical protein